MVRYSPVNGSVDDLEIAAGERELKPALGARSSEARSRGRSRHPLVIGGVAIVVLLLYVGVHWTPHRPPHPPPSFGPVRLPPHRERGGIAPGPSEVRRCLGPSDLCARFLADKGPVAEQLLTSAAPAKSYHQALRSDLRYLT